MNEIYQEFNVVVKVSPKDTNPDTIRHLLDEVVKKALKGQYVDPCGSVVTVDMSPRN